MFWIFLDNFDFFFTIVDSFMSYECDFKCLMIIVLLTFTFQSSWGINSTFRTIKTIITWWSRFTWICSSNWHFFLFIRNIDVTVAGVDCSWLNLKLYKGIIPTWQPTNVILLRFWKGCNKQLIKKLIYVLTWNKPFYHCVHFDRWFCSIYCLIVLVACLQCMAHIFSQSSCVRTSHSFMSFRCCKFSSCCCSDQHF